MTGNLVANSNGNADHPNRCPVEVRARQQYAGAAPITLTSANDFQGVVTLSNSGANAVQITDINAIQFANMTLGGNFTVNAPTVIAHDTTNTGNQLWNGNVTFNSTETTNGGNFTVTGTTTLGNSTTINTGAGNATFTGAVNATAAGQQGLTVNSTGATTFGSTIGATIPIGSLTTDAGGTSSFGGNVTTAGAAATALTPAITIGDTASGAANLTLTSTTGGLISVNQGTATFPQIIDTAGAVALDRHFIHRDAGCAAYVRGYPGGAPGDATDLAWSFLRQRLPPTWPSIPARRSPHFWGAPRARSPPRQMRPSSLPTPTAVTSPPAQAAQAVSTIAPEASSSSPTSSTSSVATVASVAASGAAPSATPVAAPEAGTVRPTASSGVSKDTIKQIDQQISQARTQLFSPALAQIAKDPSIADVPECGATGKGECVKQGKAKKTGLAGAEADPVIKRRVALLFGNDKYLAPIPKLETPVHDVQDIGKVLQDRLGYDTRVVLNATKEQIVDELNRLVTEVDEDDSVFVYYAGHGYQAEKGGGGYWIPVDASNNEASSWLSNGAISKFLANMASRQVMLVSDSCFSGTLAQEQKVTSSESTVFDRKEILRKRSVLVMSSGGNEPVADGGHDNHSLFAYHMLRSLNEVQGDLVGGDIHDRVRNAVMKEYPQDPQYGAVVSAGHAKGGEYLIEKK